MFLRSAKLRIVDFFFTMDLFLVMPGKDLWSLRGVHHP